MNGPDWTMLTETKWEWLDVANCTHIFQIQCIIAIRIKHKVVIIHYGCLSYIKGAKSSDNYNLYKICLHGSEVGSLKDPSADSFFKLPISFSS